MGDDLSQSDRVCPGLAGFHSVGYEEGRSKVPRHIAQVIDSRGFRYDFGDRRAVAAGAGKALRSRAFL